MALEQWPNPSSLLTLTDALLWVGVAKKMGLPPPPDPSQRRQRGPQEGRPPTSLSPHITQTKFLVSAPERMVAPFLYSWQEALPQTGEDKITEPLAPLVSVCLWVRSSVLGAASWEDLRLLLPHKAPLCRAGVSLREGSHCRCPQRRSSGSDHAVEREGHKSREQWYRRKKGKKEGRKKQRTLPLFRTKCGGSSSTRALSKTMGILVVNSEGQWQPRKSNELNCRSANLSEKTEKRRKLRFPQESEHLVN